MTARARVCKLIYTPAALGLSFDVTIASHVAHMCIIQSLNPFFGALIDWYRHLDEDLI